MAIIQSTATTFQSELLTLGKFELRIDGHLTPSPPTHKARALVAFLLCNRGRDVGRERLLELFWSEFEPERAREGLRTALSSVRHALRSAHRDANELLAADKSIVRWIGGTQFDVERFDALARSKTLSDKRAALQAYGGDFLEGNYEEWVVAERERIAGVYESVLADLVTHAGDLEAARLLLARNPFHEESYAALIDAELQADRPLAAAEILAQYRKAMLEIHSVPSTEFQKRFADLPEPGAVQRAARRVDHAKALQHKRPDGQTNLPPRLTTFIGRHDEVVEIKALVRHSRLVSIAGAGGIGKTRVAIEVATALRDEFEDGVWFVDLATVSDPHNIPSAIAAVLNVATSSERSIQDALFAALQNRRALLVLDNCEHLIAGSARIAEAILRNCAPVSILTTSREPLSAEGEDVFRLSALSDADAVALFAARACAADKAFVLNDRDAELVTAICRRLDRIPLAIELAAPRAGVLSLKRLRTKLDEHFRILTTDSSTVLPRHKTVRALIDWSYDLLAPPEQVMMRYAGVFVGGFTLEAAEAIFNEAFPGSDALDIVTSLVSKSLLLVDRDPDSERYRLQQTTQQYAIDRLRECGELPAVRERHARYFSTLMHDADATYGAANAREWLQRYQGEIDNVRAAIDFSFEAGDALRGAALIAAARELWQELGLYAEGLHRAEHALHVLGDAGPLDVQAGLWLVVVQHANTLALMPETALDTARRARDAFEALGDEDHLAYAWQSVGLCLLRAGAHAEAEAALERAQTLAERQGNHRVLMRALLRRAQNIFEGRSPIEALTLYERDLQLARSLQAEQYEGYILGHMAEVFFAMGDVARAISSGNSAREVFVRCKDAAKESNALANLAAYRLATEDLAAARECARSALQRAREAESRVNALVALQHLAAIAALQQQARLAAMLLGFVDAAGLSPAYTETFTREKALSALRDRLSGADLERLMKDGAVLSRDEAFAMASSIV